MAESFLAVLNTVRFHPSRYPIRNHARRDVARYIELSDKYPKTSPDARLEPRERWRRYLAWAAVWVAMVWGWVASFL